MDVGVLRRDLPGLAGAAAEIEARVRALKRRRCDARATQRVEAALEVHRARHRPERLQDRDLLVHQVVALLLAPADALGGGLGRSEAHTSELQSLMRISYAVFCL